MATLPPDRPMPDNRVRLAPAGLSATLPSCLLVAGEFACGAASADGSTAGDLTQHPFAKSGAARP